MVPCKPTWTCLGTNLEGCSQLLAEHRAAVAESKLSPCWGTGISMTASFLAGAWVHWFGAKAEDVYVCLQNSTCTPPLNVMGSLLVLIFSATWTEMSWAAHFCLDKAVFDCFFTMLIMKRCLISALRALYPHLLPLPPPMQPQQNKEVWEWRGGLSPCDCLLSPFYQSIYECAYESR